jgi:hypothetical protein
VLSSACQKCRQLPGKRALLVVLLLLLAVIHEITKKGKPLRELRQRKPWERVYFTLEQR